MARQCERGEAPGGAAQQLLEAAVLVRELQHVNQVPFMRLAVDAEQADGGRDRGLRLPRRSPLDGRQRL